MPVAAAQSVLKGTGSGALPPMLEQYVTMRDEVAAQLPHAILLFQVGDFYETFGEDAERAARLLGLALTHKSSKDFSTPMAGIPVRTLDSFVEKLLAAGVCVAVADQVEEPGAGLVERKVTQLLTPGTVTEERHLSADENFLAAVATGDGYALSLLDVSTGEFRCAAFHTRSALYDELARHRAREVLLAPELAGNAALLSDFQGRFPVMLSPANFDEAASEVEVRAALGELPGTLTSAALVRACGAVLGYARLTQQGRLDMVRRLVRYEPGAHMRLPDAAARALEVFQAQSPQGVTLMDVLCETRTAGGRRRLRAWLRAPLLDELSIRARLDAVEQLTRAPDLRGGVRALLYRAHDLERLSARVATTRATPREVASLARTLELLPEAAALLGGPDTPAGGLLSGIRARLSGLPDVVTRIRAALVDDPPLRVGDGGLIREGFHAELDALRAEALGHRAWMAELETRERERTGIAALKVGFNNVFGYYLEVTTPNLGKVPPDYRQVATLKDRARFTRADLRDREREIARLDAAAGRLEGEVFTELRASLAAHTEALLEAAGALADLDVLSALAEIAAERGWVRPVTVADGSARLTQARHPVVERAAGGRFVPNDALLDATRFSLLLTGPNMAGKSTYLRTVALCALLHQVGSFVPADAAELPVYDAIHTRIGASDDLAGGRSTFMVEMSELAAILHGATHRSLVILDEVGRGTSTLDGLAIAQAALEHLHATRAHTLFATHYFELTRLEAELPGLLNLHVAAEEDASSGEGGSERGGGLTFYHQVVPGAARQSYGVEVARLAGLPAPVTQRAARLLTALNAQGDDRALLRELATLDLSRLTPLQALEVLHGWQRGLLGQAPDA